MHHSFVCSQVFAGEAGPNPTSQALWFQFHAGLSECSLVVSISVVRGIGKDESGEKGCLGVLLHLKMLVGC